MSENTAEQLRPKGRHGCILEATTDSIYNQFSNFAVASLIYDFVAVEWLRGQIDTHVDGQDIPPRIAKTSKKFYSSALCIDPWDVTPLFPQPDDITAFKKRYPAATDTQLDFYRSFGGAVQTLNRMIELAHKKSYPEKDVAPMIDVAMQAQKVFHRFLFKLGFLSLGYEIDDGTLIDAGIDDRFNDELRPIINRGDIPLIGCGGRAPPVLRDGDVVKCLQFVIRAFRDRPESIGIPKATWF